MSKDGELRRDQSPLLGCVLCCTSIAVEQRSQMAEIAQQMGAIHRLDLTSDVTHLLVGNIDTPKYKYVARSRPDMKVLYPAWLEAVRASWMEGGRVDVGALEQEYTLPALSGLQVCITGFDDAELRTSIVNHIETNGAKYNGDLTKNVTHLVAAAPQGKKYEYARGWNIHVVSIKWLRDSIERGAALDESKYDPTLPVEAQGVGAFEPTNPYQPDQNANANTKKRQREEEDDEAPIDPGKRKLRRTMSAKLGSHNDMFWDDLSNADAAQNAEVPTLPIDHKTKPSIAVEESFAHKSKRNVGAVPRPPTTLSVTGPRGEGLFQTHGGSQLFFVDHFDVRKTAILKTHLESNGAYILSATELRDITEEQGHDVTIVIPHDISPIALERSSSRPFWPSEAPIVSDWWVEKCLYDKVVEGKTLSRYQPIKGVPLKGFSNLTICPTSFSGIDLLHFSKAVKLAGATYSEWLKPNTSILVTDSTEPNADKVQFAVHRGIPIVSGEWFWACIDAQRLLPYDDYLITLPAKTQTSQQQRPARSQTPSSDTESRKTTARSFQSKASRRPGPLELTKQGSSNLDSRPGASGGQSESSASRARPASHRSAVTPLRELSQAHNSQESQRTAALPTQAVHEDDSGMTLPDPRERKVGVPSVVEQREKENTPRDEQALSSAIEQLLANKRRGDAGVRSATPSFSESEKQHSLSRRHRPLGRAASNPSSLGPSILDGAMDDDVSGSTKRAEIPPMSQTLTYEDPDTLVANERLSKRMGKGRSTRLGHDSAGGMTRVESVGQLTAAPPAAKERSVRRTTRNKEV